MQHVTPQTCVATKIDLKGETLLLGLLMEEAKVTNHSGLRGQKIGSRSQLIYALTEVAQLEHLLMCQYIFAASSLKTDITEFSNWERKYHQLELAREWKRNILRVAREEMQHLAYANNLLISVGGAPTFSRPNFPCVNRFYRSSAGELGLEMVLEKFNPQTIERFIRFETSQVEEPEISAAFVGVPDPNYYETLHELYEAVKAAFKDGMIIDSLSQYDPSDESGRVRLAGRTRLSTVVATVKDAERLLNEIMLQGEGSSSTDPRAHVNIFRKIKAELAAEIDADSSFEPARNVVSNPLSRWHDELDSSARGRVFIADRGTDSGLQVKMLQLFNGAYEALITWLSQLFSQHGSKQELRAIETLTFLPFMSEVISPISEILTRIPTKNGETKFLGASFEVTTNNFLLPSPNVSGIVTREKIAELEKLSGEALEILRTLGMTKVAEEVSFLTATFKLLGDEFASRVEKGWPPSPSTDEDKKFAEVAKDPHEVSNPPAVLNLAFQGWAQCRLPTDPDGANVKRGISGNTFAIGDEPDLDRIIRFQPSGAVVRTHCPEIGVKVTSARLLASTFHSSNSGEVVPGLVGASVNLLGNPKFEGRNHLVSEDGEPIDPFDLQIDTLDGQRLRRRVLGGSVNDMTPVQRRGTGRYPTNLFYSREAVRGVLQRADSISSPQDWVTGRIEALKRDLIAIPEAKKFGKEATELQFRLKVLETAGLGGNIRWMRFFFDAFYLHTISGEMEVSIDKIQPKVSVRQDKDSPWLVSYHIGFYDTDALSAFIYGYLQIPIDRK